MKIKRQSSKSIIAQIAINKHIHHERQKSHSNSSDNFLGAFTWMYSLMPALLINRIIQHANNAVIIVKIKKLNNIIVVPNKCIIFYSPP